MPTFETIMIVVLAGFALSVTPGQSMLYILSRSVGQSRSAGVASAIGLGLGGVALATATALGLAAVFSTTTLAMDGLRIAGSLYLVYLGVQMIHESHTVRGGEFKVRSVRERSFSSIVWQGILVEVLNPKTILFFVLFIPQFVEAGVDPTETPNVTLQLLVLSALVPLTAVPSDLAVAYIGGSLAKKVNDNPNIRLVLGWLGGIVLIAIALNLHFDFLA